MYTVSDDLFVLDDNVGYSQTINHEGMVSDESSDTDLSFDYNHNLIIWAKYNNSLYIVQCIFSKFLSSNHPISAILGSY